MNKKLITAATVLTVVCGCQTETPLEGDFAIFDYFKYSGHDKIYDENPLTQANQYYNPIIPGWYSDPSICDDGENYYLVTSTFSYFPGVPIFQSKDLINWVQIGNILNRESQLLNFDGGGISEGIFAPQISYCKLNKTYYMITTNVRAGNFIVKTQDPMSNNWSDPISLPKVGGIDPSLFIDDDGKAYIVNNDGPETEPEYDGHRSIWVRQYDINTDQIVGDAKVIVNKGVHPEDKPIWVEGPHLYKIDGKYYLMCAEGGTGDGHSEVIFVSDSPMGTYKPCAINPILTQRDLPRDRQNPISCAGHADLVKGRDGNTYAVFLATRPIMNGNGENLGRETWMLPVSFAPDGQPVILPQGEEIPLISSVSGSTRGNNTTFGNFEKIENFSDTILPMDWMTLRKPALDKYSLTKVPGYLALNFSDVKSTSKSDPALVCRRIQHHSFTAETVMTLCNKDQNKAAGIIIFKDETHQYFLSAENKDKGKLVSVIKVSATGNETLGTLEISDNAKELKLKVTSDDGNSFKFFCNDTLILENVDAYYLTTASANGFTGTVVGLYAEKK